MEHRPVLTSEWKKPKCLQYHNPTILDYSGWKKQVHEPFAVSWLSLITCLELCCQLPLTRISESVIPSYLLFLARCELVSHFLISHPDANTHTHTVLSFSYSLSPHHFCSDKWMTGSQCCITASDHQGSNKMLWLVQMTTFVVME